MSALFLEILDQNRLATFLELKNFARLGILSGGTAIALQIGHRRSFDFDIFFHRPLPANLWRKIREEFGPGCIKTLDTEDQLDVTRPEGIAVSFFYDDYQPLFTPIKTESIDLMDLRDLASNKAITIGKRGKWRDYVDVYFLLKEGKTTIAEIITVSEKRTHGEFSARLFLQQLTYFGDISDFQIDFLKESVPSEEVKKLLVDEVKVFEAKNL